MCWVIGLFCVLVGIAIGAGLVLASRDIGNLPPDDDHPMGSESANPIQFLNQSGEQSAE